MELYTNNFMRMVFLPLLKATAFDFSIAHHWTKDRLWLNSFRHKGYWYHGRRREFETLQIFARLIEAGDTVVEVGGHIGYVSLWFSSLVGPSGRVFVFEPGQNNLPYIRKNIRNKGNVTLVEKGCGPRAETADFYEDNLTGQNNSFVKNFTALGDNSHNAPGVRVEVEVRRVEVCRVDDFMARHDLQADFVKIDTEGYELAVLQGCLGLLRQAVPPKFMVEVQADEASILELFTQHGYLLFTEAGQQVETVALMSWNLFALHPIHHAEAIKRWRAARTKHTKS